MKLIRTHTNAGGTFGRLLVGEGVELKTVELPWRDNETGRSCIPEGEYPISLFRSPRHGLCVRVADVPGRSNVRIHAGNWPRDSRGCVLPGMGLLEDGTGVGMSRNAMTHVLAAVERGDDVLTVLSAIPNIDMEL